jgi:uncharacterized protein
VLPDTKEIPVTSLPPPQPLTFASDGVRLAGRLFRPGGEPRGSLLVCHGAGSNKENHTIMGEQAAAAGLAALTFDLRGHGESQGVMGPSSWRDVIAAADTLRARSGAPWVAGRGVSLGGLLLLLAARAQPELFSSLVVLCPADGPVLLAGLDRIERATYAGDAGGGYAARFDAATLRPALAGLDVAEIARGLPRVLLAHARDDEVVPFAVSERLSRVLAPPTELIVLESGGHHGPGRSPEVARATLEWIVGNVAARAA